MTDYLKVSPLTINSFWIYRSSRLLKLLSINQHPIFFAPQEKLCCSLRWLSSVVPPRQLQEEVGSGNGTNGRVTVKQLLLSPYQRSTLREEVINLLISPNLYICAHGAIIPNERLEGDNTFWPLIQSLAKRGIYVLEEDESVVNHPVLAQKDPFKPVSFPIPSIIHIHFIHCSIPCRKVTWLCWMLL